MLVCQESWISHHSHKETSSATESNIQSEDSYKKTNEEEENTDVEDHDPRIWHYQEPELCTLRWGTFAITRSENRAQSSTTQGSLLLKWCSKIHEING